MSRYSPEDTRMARRSAVTPQCRAEAANSKVVAKQEPGPFRRLKLAIQFPVGVIQELSGFLDRDGSMARTMKR